MISYSLYLWLLSVRAIHEEVVMRTLNEVKGVGSINATPEHSTLYLAEIRKVKQVT